MALLKRLTLTSALAWLLSCSRAPECTFKGDVTSEANAGCFVIYNNKALFVEGKNGKLSLPGGTKKSGEAPQCTAERETWEETGIIVTAQEKIHTFENGFQLYNCELLDIKNLDGSNKPWGLEIDAIHWLATDDLDSRRWRFPEQVGFLKNQLQSRK